MDERLSIINVRLGWIPRLRVLLGVAIQVKIAHRGTVDKVIIFLGADEIGQVVA